ncbi:tRNA pseudouridine(13) synthase TruD [Candidatus Woesearchaeota archaeon]|nr:tRNA pseudouridine(13) synthase TruD [Candidatus Woesearchaeota archaeon]
MYTLKHLPEDFIVVERASLKLTEKGLYLYVRCIKRERTTLEVISHLAKVLGIFEKDIGFAGTKDMHGITTQFLSLRSVKAERLSNLKLHHVQLEVVGYGATPLSLGDLEGNYFEITVRDLDEKNVLIPLILSPNYFDEQRFSTRNIQVGRALLKKDFKTAAGLIDHTSCEEYLAAHPTNPVGAIRTLPDRLIRLYLNAYQSYLWNEAVGLYLRSVGKNVKEVAYSAGSLVFIDNQEDFCGLQFPLPGFGNMGSNDPAIEQALNTILTKESMTGANFVIRQIPNLSLEGELRSMFVPVSKLKIGEYENDECFDGKYKVKVCFFLPKGSYATMFVRRLFTT